MAASIVNNVIPYLVSTIINYYGPAFKPPIYSINNL